MVDEAVASDLIPADAAPSVHDLDPASRAELSHALNQLTSGGGFVFRVADLAGDMLGRGLRAGARTAAAMPGLSTSIHAVTEAALARAFNIAIIRLNNPSEQERSRRIARPLVVLSGAVGGFIGLGGFVPDATVTSLAIMREIARIAQQEGEDLSDRDTRASCLQVFALNGATTGHNSREAAYFSARLMMQGRPLAFLLREAASRYGITLSQKFALQATPIVGAIGGAALNAAFLSHYRDLAHAHFTIRRLERTFGEPAIRRATAQAG